MSGAHIPPEIIRDFIPEGHANRPGFYMEPRYITIHDTGNPAAYADSFAHAAYLQSATAANKPVSWHFSVCSRGIVQHLPFDEPGWHAGDGTYGAGNRQSIGIEICENADGNRAQAEANAAWLVAWLLREIGRPLEIVQHNRWSGKNCPRIIRERPNGWALFLAEVERMERNTKVAQLTKADAEKIIRFLSAGWFATESDEARAEFNRLANLLRGLT